MQVAAMCLILLTLLQHVYSQRCQDSKGRCKNVAINEIFEFFAVTLIEILIIYQSSTVVPW